jgi:hypothetical protein
VELSLTFRGFGAGDARAASLCRAEYAVVSKNAGAVSGLAKPFPGRNWRREQRPVRLPTETGSSFEMTAYARTDGACCWTRFSGNRAARRTGTGSAAAPSLGICLTFGMGV